MEESELAVPVVPEAALVMAATDDVADDDVAAVETAITHFASEKDAKLGQKLRQLQHFIAAFPRECMGQLA